MSQDLKSFEKFMLSYSKWTLSNKSKEMLTYEHTQEAKKGSCLIALILFIFFIIPGILYLYFSSKPEKRQRFTVSVDESGDLWASGDREGQRLLQAYKKQLEVPISSNAPKSATQPRRIDTTPFYKTWWGIILLVIFWPFALQSIAVHYIWNETNWEDNQKWLAFAGIVALTFVVFIVYNSLT